MWRFQEQLDLLGRFPKSPFVAVGAIHEHHALLAAIHGETEQALALARMALEVFATRDSRALRVLTPTLFRGDASEGDTERACADTAVVLPALSLPFSALISDIRLIDASGRSQ